MKWLWPCLSLLWACETLPVGDAARPSELDRVRVVQALDLLRPRLGSEPQLLELRVTPEAMTAQLAQVELGRVVQYRCTFEADGQPSPQVDGPVVLTQQGTGTLSDNSFPLAELDLGKVSAAFELAKKAIDPSDGRVQELVVRRYLPFGKAVRARIYVNSPRMSGSLDTSPSGVPIKP